MKNFALVLFVLVNVFSFAHAKDVQIVDAFSLYGKPKYSSNFKNFAYVNPQAPKGGKITLPAYGNFDNFNPFIFKCIASPEAADLSLESLGAFAADDAASVYPLIAQKFEMPLENSFIVFLLNPNDKFSYV